MELNCKFCCHWTDNISEFNEKSFVLEYLLFFFVYSKVCYTSLSFRCAIHSFIHSFITWSTNCLTFLICFVGKIVFINIICIFFILGHIGAVWSSAKWWNWDSNIWNMGYATTLYDNFERHRAWWKIKGMLTAYLCKHVKVLLFLIRYAVLFLITHTLCCIVLDHKHMDFITSQLISFCYNGYNLDNICLVWALKHPCVQYMKTRLRNKLSSCHPLNE
jgi:hypothetical protein